MKKPLIFIISITFALPISGFTPRNMAISIAALTIVLWVKALKNIWAPSLYAINNPQQHNPELIALALGRCLKEINCTETGLRLLISNPGINPLTIRNTPDKGLIVQDSHRALRVKNGDLWIAEHPLPLLLKAGQWRQLNFTRSGDGRIHVSTGESANYGRLPLILIPLAIILYFFNFHSLIAVLAAPMLHTLLTRCFVRQL